VLDINGGTEDPLTEVIVEKIVKLAKAGGRDPTRMCISVLAALESPSSPACCFHPRALSDPAAGAAYRRGAKGDRGAMQKRAAREVWMYVKPISAGV
jgi:hypothetical protein